MFRSDLLLAEAECKKINKDHILITSTFSAVEILQIHRINKKAPKIREYSKNKFATPLT
jgi:hypothetical protein